jgi:hypothetical protein
LLYFFFQKVLLFRRDFVLTAVKKIRDTAEEKNSKLDNDEKIKYVRASGKARQLVKRFKGDSKAACPIPIPPGANGIATVISPIGIRKNCVANSISSIPIKFATWKKSSAIKVWIPMASKSVSNKVVFWC